MTVGAPVEDLGSVARLVPYIPRSPITVDLEVDAI